LETRSLAAGGVALTAFARAEDRRRALARAYQAHISKPVKVVELLGLLAIPMTDVTGRSHT
jgi:CheY-like chemotaxis protein